MSPWATRLRPQRPSGARAVVTSSEWLFEPYWRGERLLVHLSGERVDVTDAAGDAVDAGFSELVDAIREAVDAEHAVIDGVWSEQPFAESDQELERRAFVAVDLLELDGQQLVDLPLLERRRLLEAIVSPSPTVRVSTAVRQPIGSWLIAWRQIGFDSYLAKHANSRYLPGEINAQWLRMSTAPPRAPRAITGLLGRRRMPEREIRD